MLVSLNIKDFAIIDNISIDFTDKMTVITGETGAGKSLLIDAIGLLFGDRASMDMINKKSNKAVIEGVFYSDNQNLYDKLEEIGVKDEDNIIIRRELFDNGKSICRINSIAVSLSQLQNISCFLGDIHSQYDTIRLVNPKNYLNLLDDEKIKEVVLDYQNSLAEFKKISKKINQTINEYSDQKEKYDFLVYQENELKQMNLNLDEEEKLNKRLTYLNNIEEISNNVNMAYENLNNEISDKLYECINYLNKVEKYDQSFIEIRQEMEEAYYMLSEIITSLSHKLPDTLDDNHEIDQINERIANYESIKRKYRKNTQELINLYSNICQELDNYQNYDFNLNQLLLEKDKILKILMAKATLITQLRKDKCSQIEENVLNTLKDLQIQNASFKINFNEVDKENPKFFDNGTDCVDFMVSFNVGEALKPLSKCASGGELSRFMLALKTYLLKNIQPMTIIFDEIDAGVSGKVAYSVAQKMKEISTKHQVLCITHLPQVAAISDKNLLITKEEKHNQTKTHAKILSNDERIVELAKMISKDKISDASIELAKELLKHK